MKITDERVQRAFEVWQREPSSAKLLTIFRKILEDFESQRPAEQGFTLEEIEAASNSLWNRCGPPSNGTSLNGVGFSRRLREELASKPKTPKDKVLDILNARRIITVDNDGLAELIIVALKEDNHG